MRDPLAWQATKGRYCPSPGHAEVFIQLRLDEGQPPLERYSYPAKILRWDHFDNLGDIIAWRRAHPPP